MKKRFLQLMAALVFSPLFLVGCQVGNPPVDEGPGDGNTPSDAEQAQQLATAGIDLMKQKDWDGALTKFGEAVLKDPNNGTAVIGYAALNIASVAADGDVVLLAKNNLGLADYPSAMNEVLDPTVWLEQNPAYGLLPRITNQESYDGIFSGGVHDGIIDANERTYAFMAYFMSHNTGFDAVVDTVMGALGARLDAAIAAIKNAPDDIKFTLTWDMYLDSAPTATSYSWPMKGDTPMDVTIGKPEILAIAAALEVVRACTYLVQVYNLTLPLGDYWASYNPIDGTQVPPSTKPFDTFLTLSADAATKLAGAKTSYLAALDDLNSSASQLKTNRSGFFLSTDPASGIFADQPSGWDGYKKNLSMTIKVCTEVRRSITDITMAYLPINFYSFDPDTSSWPTSIVPGMSIGINYGAYFSTPLNLVASLLDLETNGEPAYYRFTGGDFTKVTASYMNATFNNNFQNNDPQFFLRIPDSTLSGVLPTANYPKDDPATRFSFSMNYTDTSLDGRWTWNDNNSNGNWDPGEGESISGASLYPIVEGFVDMTAGLAAAYGGDPGAYYATTVANIPDAMLDAYLASPSSADRDALRAALTAFHPSLGFAILVYLKGASVYEQAMQASIAWNSFAPAGTAGTDVNGFPITSAGSIWWYYGKMLL